MGFQKTDSWLIGCPHTFQDYVGCNDETLMKCSLLVNSIMMDPALRALIRQNDSKSLMQSLNAYQLLYRILIQYDVHLSPINRQLFLFRYERPATPPELHDSEKLSRYIRETNFNLAMLPIDIADVARAFGEYVGAPIRQDVIDHCLGFFDSPDARCDRCGKNWERTWDNHEN